MSSCRWINEVRPAQYRSSMSVGSTVPAASHNTIVSCVPTDIPFLRSARQKPWRTSTSSTPASGMTQYVLQVAVHHLEIVAVLDHGAEGVSCGLFGEVGLAQELQRASPVDGLSDARRLGQFHLAQAVDRSYDLPGQHLGDLRTPGQHDLDLALRLRV